MAGAVGTAVANREQSQEMTPMKAIQHQLTQYRPVIEKLLVGTGTTVETFTAQLANAVRAVPDLVKCNPESVLGCALKAAQLGLAPNDTRNLCWILPYGGTAQFSLGYGGVMELARRATPGIKFRGAAVYPNDDFDLDMGLDRPVKHKPAALRGLPRGGQAFLWYVLVTFPDGDQQVGFLDREGVEYHRKFSKQANGQMWTKSYDAAALKSVVSDMKRWLPSNPQIAMALAADEETFDVRRERDLVEVRHSPERSDVPELPAAADEPSAPDEPAATDQPSGEPEPPPPPAETTPDPPRAQSRQRQPAPKQTDRASVEQYGDVVETKATESPAAGGEASLSGPEMIAMLAGQHGAKTSDDRARMCSQIVGREVVSSKDLRPAEQGKVIATLNGLGEDVDFEFAQPPAAPVENATPEPDGSAPVAPAPAAQQRGVSPDQWDAPTWRKKINDAHMKVSAVMPEVRRLGLALDPAVTIASLEEIAGSGIGADLYGWLEDNAVPDGGRS